MYTSNSLLALGSTLLLLSPAVLATPVAAPAPVPTDYTPPTPGWCGIHVTQFQKNEGPPALDGGNVGTTVDYRFNIQVFNDYHSYEDQLVQVDAPTAVPIEATTGLAYSVFITAGEVDSDPVSFSFGPTSWDSNASPQCSVGGYDNGQREMDCGFSCR